MATISFNIQDFFSLIDKELDMEELDHKLAMLGVPIEGIVDDTIEVEVSPNRPDLLSVEGIARAFRGFIGQETGNKKYKLERSGVKINVDLSVKEIRPFIACSIVKDVAFNDEFIASIMQIQEKLHATIGRKRVKAAIGVYDYDTIEAPIFFKALEPNMIEFEPLSDGNTQYGWMSAREILLRHPKGKDYAQTLENFEKFPLLVDSKSLVLALIPIINSDDTRVEEGTKNIFIDVTGTDLKTVMQVNNILSSVFAERGAKLESVEIIYPDDVIISSPSFETRSMDLEVSYANKLLGLALDAEDCAELLKKMRFGAIVKNNSSITAQIPSYRTDIMHSIDLVEEIAIAYGYDMFDISIPRVPTTGKELDLEKNGRYLRQLLLGFGFTEVINFIISNPRKQYEKMNCEENDFPLIENPNSSDYTSVRTWLLPLIMENLFENRMDAYPQKLFEIGDISLLDESSDVGSVTIRRCGGVIADVNTHFAHIKGIILELFSNLGIPITLESFEHNSFISGRAARILVNNAPVGYFGEIHPEVIVQNELEIPITAFEFNVEEI